MKRTFIAAGVAALLTTPAAAWDSDTWLNITHATHSYLTEGGIARAGNAEVTAFEDAILAGANTELHELEIDAGEELYGVPLNAKRIEHKGTNAGTDDIEGWWSDAVAAYEAGNKEQAYFYVGVMLHMIEDMGVPAHAHRIEHQAFDGFDNFELMGLSNWKPDEAEAINKTDPGYADPSNYYAFSEAWTLEDAPSYDKDEFSKTWTFGDDEDKQLLANRQARTREVVAWTLKSVAKALAAL